MTGIERLSALADEMARGGWRGIGEELRRIAGEIEREQETDGAAHGRRAERTCRAVMPPYEPGAEEIPVCSECGTKVADE